jgi:hypothetical protein
MDDDITFRTIMGGMLHWAMPRLTFLLSFEISLLKTYCISLNPFDNIFVQHVGGPLTRKVSSSHVIPKTLSAYEKFFRSSSNPERGWLEVKYGRSALWKKKWVEFADGALRLGQNKETALSDFIIIQMSNVVAIRTDNSLKEETSIFITTTEHRLILRAETKDDMFRWLFCFQKSVALVLSSLLENLKHSRESEYVRGYGHALDYKGISARDNVTRIETPAEDAERDVWTQELGHGHGMHSFAAQRRRFERDPNRRLSLPLDAPPSPQRASSSHPRERSREYAWSNGLWKERERSADNLEGLFLRVDSISSSLGCGGNIVGRHGDFSPMRWDAKQSRTGRNIPTHSSAMCKMPPSISHIMSDQPDSMMSADALSDCKPDPYSADISATRHSSGHDVITASRTSSGTYIQANRTNSGNSITFNVINAMSNLSTMQHFGSPHLGLSPAIPIIKQDNHVESETKVAGSYKENVEDIEIHMRTLERTTSGRMVEEYHSSDFSEAESDADSARSEDMVFELDEDSMNSPKRSPRNSPLKSPSKKRKALKERHRASSSGSGRSTDLHTSRDDTWHDTGGTGSESNQSSPTQRPQPRRRSQTGALGSDLSSPRKVSDCAVSPSPNDTMSSSDGPGLRWICGHCSKVGPRNDNEDRLVAVADLLKSAPSSSGKNGEYPQRQG